jgi:hypothetical protein
MHLKCSCLVRFCAPLRVRACARNGHLITALDIKPLFLQNIKLICASSRKPEINRNNSQGGAINNIINKLWYLIFINVHGTISSSEQNVQLFMPLGNATGTLGNAPNVRDKRIAYPLFYNLSSHYQLFFFSLYACL